MKRIQMEQNSEEWLQWRKAKITGSRLKDIIMKRGTGRKLGFYEILAERLSMDTSQVDNPMERGHELEVEAIKEFENITGLKVNPDCGVWVSDESEYIALSPDGEISDTAAVEVKCLSSARHLQALIEQEIPGEYDEQVAQYFIVNDKLEQLYFVFYDPRIECKPLHYIIVDRADILVKIDAYREYEKEALAEIDALVEQLTY